MVTPRLLSEVHLASQFTRRWAGSNCSTCAPQRYFTLSSRDPSTTTEFDNTLETEYQTHEATTPRFQFPHKLNIFSLIQPTGIPHLGNYLGALRVWRELQDDQMRRRASNVVGNRQLYFGLADLHALTAKIDHVTRQQNIRETYASLLALGIGARRSQDTVLFVQSHIPMHSEMMWILSNIASMGYLGRMTQWKDKLAASGDHPTSSETPTEGLDEAMREQLKLGLFSYPVLQAADILLYRANYVPVGEDQAQHIEFARQIARSFDSTYCSHLPKAILKLPRPLFSPARRVMSLQSPSQKMSKSQGTDLSRILITDSPDVIRSKVKRAKTDSVVGPITYDPVSRPGVSNLVQIYRHVSRSTLSPEEIAAEHASTSLGAFKSLVAEEIIQDLDGVRDRFEELMLPGNMTVDETMGSGNRRASHIAGEVLQEVKEAIGLIPPKFVMKEMD